LWQVEGMTRVEEEQEGEVVRAAEEQAALRRVATLIAAGVADRELIVAVTHEIGRLFGADKANVMRWEADTIRVLGDWSAGGSMLEQGRVYAYGGDTITARVVEAEGPRRINSRADLNSDFARERWDELGIEASIGAPIVLDGRVWGVVTASRREADNPFPPQAEHRLGDFAALVAQAIANAEARREMAALIAEQSALRRVATLVAGGRPQTEVLDAVAFEVGVLFEAAAVTFVRWEGVQDEVVVVAGWSAVPSEGVKPGALEHPVPGSATLAVLETGFASRSEESMAERGSTIAAPVISHAQLVGALVAQRAPGEPFPAEAEVRLRSFADLAGQAIANERAQEELRASRARIVRTADETRQRLERNLHDGAQQRLVSVSIALRLAVAKLPLPDEARGLIASASEELTLALAELRDLARGLHPSILTDLGLGPALESLARRAPIPCEVVNEIDGTLPGQVQAALYYVVSESLTNVAKYAQASRIDVRASCVAGVARVHVADDGIGGANPDKGSGLGGLHDRVEALGGRLVVESPHGNGTTVVAEIPLEGH
jgi:signal transduction histidine kinase